MDGFTPNGLAPSDATPSVYAQFTSVSDAAAEYADLYNLNDIGLAMRVHHGRID